MTGFLFTSHPGYVAAIKLRNLVYLQRESPAKQTRENIPVITCNITANKKPAALTLCRDASSCILRYSLESLQDMPRETGEGEIVCLSEWVYDWGLLSAKPRWVACRCDALQCVCVSVCIITRYWVFSPLLQPAEHRNGSSAQEWGNV